MAKLIVETKEKPVKEIEQMLTKGECRTLIEKHQEHLTSIRVWNKFRKLNKQLHLPHSKEISRLFGSWNGMKQELNLEINSGGGRFRVKVETKKFNIVNLEKLNSDEILSIKNSTKELITIIEPHKDYLKTSKMWDQYRNENAYLKLPQSQKITRAFSSWKIMRQVLDIKEPRIRKPKKIEIKKIGNRIKKIRMNKGLTQLQLSEMINIHVKTIGNWENGESIPKKDILILLAAVGGVSFEYLLYGTNSGMSKAYIENMQFEIDIKLRLMPTGKLLFEGPREECNQHLKQLLQNTDEDLVELMTNLHFEETYRIL